MLTKEQVTEAIQSGKDSGCLDGRDVTRLAQFFEVDEYASIGVELKEGVTPEEIPAAIDWTEETILKQLEEDLEFALDKATGERGISSSLMYEVVKQWLWILEDDLAKHDDYCDYGKDFFFEVKRKYKFEYVCYR